jgi:hypothetical protein
VQDIYTVKIKYRAEVFEIYSDFDPEKIGLYNTESEEYKLYTRSTYHTCITPRIRGFAQKAIGDENNAYLQAKRIFKFVRTKMRYKRVKHLRGSGTENLLKFPFTDPHTGNLYFEGQCNHYSVFFVAMCRAVGIPARGVNGLIGWGPWIKKEDLELYADNVQTELSSDGLSATRVMGSLSGHIWAEFFFPDYGWIPVDPTWGVFGCQGNNKVTLSKGRDIELGPNAPQQEHQGYGEQWIPIFNGKVDVTVCGVWNIAKIRVAKAKLLHTSDPFPADAYAEYAKNLFPINEKKLKLRESKIEQMQSLYQLTRESQDTVVILEQTPMFIAFREAYACHVLRQIVGDEKFQKIFENYLNLRSTIGKSVTTEKFQEITDEVYGASLDFFFEEWLDSTTLPQLRLENVTIEKREKDWKVYGRLDQEGMTFHIPVELALETENGQENQKIWLDSSNTDFKFITSNKPEKLTVDPDFNIPTVRWMPSHLNMLWNSYPELTVIFGTLAEAEANKKAAQRFMDEFAGLDHELIKADTAVTENDLQKSLILFGRPETNKISRRFRDSFPVKFEKDRFSWQDTVYERPTQGVALIIENPLDHRNSINLYAGLSGDATLKVCDTSEWQEELDGWLLIDYNSSYIIYDNHKKLVSGDWEDTKSNLVWYFPGSPME